MYTLIICIGFLAAMCGDEQRHSYPDKASCEKARQEAVKGLHLGYALCLPPLLKE